MAELCRTELRCDSLIEPGEHSLAELSAKCKCFDNCAVSKATHVRQSKCAQLVTVAEKALSVSCKQLFLKSNMDSVWTDRVVRCLIGIWDD